MKIRNKIIFIFSLALMVLVSAFVYALVFLNQTNAIAVNNHGQNIIFDASKDSDSSSKIDPSGKMDPSGKFGPSGKEDSSSKQDSSQNDTTTFNCNGGAFPDKSLQISIKQNLYPGSTYSVPEKLPVKDGYVFMG